MKYLAFAILLFMVACQTNKENKQEAVADVKTISAENYNSVVPFELRKQITEEVKKTITEGGVSEKKSNYRLGNNYGDLKGINKGSDLRYMIINPIENDHVVREYYFFNKEAKPYYGVVIKKGLSGQAQYTYSTYWMDTTNDSVYVEEYLLNQLDPVTYIPSAEPSKNHKGTLSNYSEEILPNKYKAFLVSVDHNKISENTAEGIVEKRITLGENQTGMDVGVIAYGQTIRYEVKLNKAYTYLVAINPLEQGFMLRGKDNGKVFIEGHSDFQWFTDKDDDILVFEVYNNTLKEGESRNYRVAVFGEPRF